MPSQPQGGARTGAATCNFIAPSLPPLPSPRRRVASSTSLCIPHASIRFALVILRAYIPGYYTLNRYVFAHSVPKHVPRKSRTTSSPATKLSVNDQRRKVRRDSSPTNEAGTAACSPPSFFPTLSKQDSHKNSRKNLQAQHRLQYLEIGPELQKEASLGNKPNGFPPVPHFSSPLLLPPTKPLGLPSCPNRETKIPDRLPITRTLSSGTAPVII